MTDDQHLGIVDDAFADFRSGGPLGVPPGVEAVRGTVRRRRTARTVTAAALAALVVAVPVAVHAANDGDSNAPPVPGASGNLTPTVSASAASSPPPSASAGAPSAADGRIVDPASATLPMPAWPAFPNVTCPTGPLTFVKGKAAGSVVNLMKFVHADVDADGALETVVLLRCSPGRAVAEVVVAYEKGIDGKAVLLGKVVQNAPTGMERIDDLRADGTHVQVRVGDRALCCNMPAETTQWQWRTYGWNGGAFEQSGGPTAFPQNPHLTDLAVEVPAEMILTKDPQRTDPQGFFGEITFSVRNFGPVPTGTDGRLVFDMTNRMTVISPPDGCKQEETRLFCPLSLAAGQARTFTFKVSALSSLVGPWNEKTRVSAEMAPSLTGFERFDDLDEQQPGHAGTALTLITEIH